MEVEVHSSFAHDRGMEASVKSILVNGEPCEQSQILRVLVAARKGWTRSGGSSEAEVLATLRAYEDAWAAALAHTGRETSDTIPSGLQRALSGAAREVGFGYHPPRYALYALDDGEKIAVGSWFASYDGGNHGTQWVYCVSAYRVSDGSPYEIAPAPRPRGLLPQPAPASKGPQPVDPKIPRPAHFSESGH